MPKKAFVIIDLQNDITKNYKDIIENVNRSIQWASVHNLPVVYIRHENLSPGTRTFKMGTFGSELVPDLNVVSTNIFTKYKGNALSSQDFMNFINQNNISEFYILGADAAVCVKSTCYNLCKAGFHVKVLADCITSYDKKKLTEMLNYYEKQGCKIISTNDLL